MTGPLDRYVEGLRAGRLLLPRCGECHSATWPPRDLCTRCGGELFWETAPATASLFTWTVVHRTPLAEFADLVPYAVGVLAFAYPGLRVVGRLGAAPECLTVDSSWTWHIETGPTGELVPVWRASAGQEAT